MGGLARRGESLLGACRWLIWRMIWWDDEEEGGRGELKRIERWRDWSWE